MFKQMPNSVFSVSYIPVWRAILFVWACWTLVPENVQGIHIGCYNKQKENHVQFLIELYKQALKPNHCPFLEFKKRTCCFWNFIPSHICFQWPRQLHVYCPYLDMRSTCTTFFTFGMLVFWLEIGNYFMNFEVWYLESLWYQTVKWDEEAFVINLSHQISWNKFAKWWHI